eukprot:UN09871
MDPNEVELGGKGEDLVSAAVSAAMPNIQVPKHQPLGTYSHTFNPNIVRLTPSATPTPQIDVTAAKPEMKTPEKDGDGNKTTTGWEWNDDGISV